MKGRILFLGVLCIGVEAMLLSLANWQHNRYQQRLSEQQVLANRLPVDVFGKFLNADTAALDNQPNPENPEGEVGWRILTPLQNGDNLVIVDRGWTLPKFKKDGTPDFSSFVTEATQAKGITQPYPKRHGWLQGPDTTTHPQLLAFLNPQQIISTSAVNLTLAPEYVIAITPTGGTKLLAAQPPVPAPLRHLSYMYQWLGMAIAFPILCGVTWVKGRQRKKRHS